ncbi:MAG: GTPase [Planctomycetota bacterium]
MADAACTTAWLQTPPGRGGIAVVALSGPGRERLLGNIFTAGSRHRRDKTGQLQLGRIHDQGEAIDQAVVCRTDRHTEINIHGGPQAVRDLLALIARHGGELLPPDHSPLPDWPLAHPRWNNPAIGAELAAVLGQALSETVLAALSQQWSAGLSELVCRGDTTAGELEAAADGLAVMQRLVHPPDVVLAGPPNAGKSTLANVLVGREVSIVHVAAGTTRDWVRELALLSGLPVWLTDTAGIWDVPEGIDAEAIRRARDRARAADLVVLLAPGIPPEPPAWLTEQHSSIRPAILRVAAKADLVPPEDGLPVAASTGEGLGELRQAILTKLELAQFDPTLPRTFTTRQADLLRQAIQAPQRQPLLDQLLSGS